jgi:L-cystine uptake protein TcyP (sodium:dicarboxylate symporter family)
MEINQITAPVFPASEQGPNSVGRLFSVLSLALFIFLITFWVAISSVQSTRTLALWVGFGSLAALTLGVVFGIVGIACRSKTNDRATLVMGIIGLSINGIILLLMLLLILISAVATVVRLHKDNPTNPVSVAQPQTTYNTTTVRYINPPAPIFIRPMPTIQQPYFPPPPVFAQHH